METSLHTHYMRMALKEAAKAMESNEVPVGAVIVHGGKVIARAHNQCDMLRDPTAHAEMIAMTQASEHLASQGDRPDHRGSLEGATLYVTMEPCPMCAGALVMTKCTHLVYGVKDPKAGACESLYSITNDDRLNHRLNIVTGVLEDESRNILQEFFRNLRKEKR